MARKAPTASVSAFQPIIAGISGLVSTVSQTISKTISTVTSVIAAIATGGASAAAGGGGGGGGGGGPDPSMLVTAVSTFVTAAIQVAQTLMRATEVASKFVEALNPALVEQFGFHLRNLMATIGVALEPIFQVLNDTVPKIANLLEPAMTALAPAVSVLTSALSDLLIVIVQQLVAHLLFFMPLIQQSAENFKVATTALRIFSMAVISVVASLLRMIPGLGGVAAQLEQINRGGGQGRQAALQGASVGSLDNLMSQLDQAAFTATQPGSGFENEVVNNMEAIIRLLERSLETRPALDTARDWIGDNIPWANESRTNVRNLLGLR